MENSNISTCLFLAMDLETPVSLGTVFESGIDYNSHISLLTSPTLIPCEDLEKEVKNWNFNFPAYLRNQPEYMKVLELFDLSVFSKKYVVLKLKDTTKLYSLIKPFSDKLHEKYVKSGTLPIPHLRLAEIPGGSGEKYTKNDALINILEHSMIRPEDLVVSYSSKDKYKEYSITSFHASERYFRVRELENEE